MLTAFLAISRNYTPGNGITKSAIDLSDMKYESDIDLLAVKYESNI